MKNTPPKIHLRKNSNAADIACAWSGVPPPFTAEWPYWFFLDGDLDKPVSAEVALKNGFTMSKDDFEELHRIVGEAIRRGIRDPWGCCSSNRKGATTARGEQESVEF